VSAPPNVMSSRLSRLPLLDVRRDGRQATRCNDLLMTKHELVSPSCTFPRCPRQGLGGQLRQPEKTKIEVATKDTRLAYCA
jgi:hypothetical protein